MVASIDGWMVHRSMDDDMDGWMYGGIDRWMDGDINLDNQWMDRLKDRQYCTA